MVSVFLQIKPSLKTHKLNKLYFPCRVIDQLTETWSVKNKQKHQQKRLKEKTLKREIRVFIRQRPRSSHGLYTGIFFSVLPFRPAFSCELANMIRMPKARFRRRSTHVPNLTEFGSTLERHWRDIWFRRRTVCRT